MDALTSPPAPAPADAPPAAAAGPLPAYRDRIASGLLTDDPAQLRAAERLQELWRTVRGYDPVPMAPSTNLFARLRRRKKPDDVPDLYPNGLYLVGEVGRGKSMLMDLFFDQAQVARKRRIHFHRFMQDAHRRIHQWKQANPSGDDPIPPLADAFAGEAALLCFDEFQVNDIADAMILGRLFQALFERGVVVVATSNTKPDDLFRDRPGRDAFLPFIALLQRHLDVLVLEGARDWRRARLRGMPTWYVPADAAAEQALEEAFEALTGGAQPRRDRLLVAGRSFEIPLAAQGVARFDFEALCGQPLGPGDYLALATHYHALVLDDIPKLSPANHDRARRFITLIDSLYDHRVKLVASAAASPDLLYQQGEGAVAFQRTASRLEEMQSQDYLKLPHLT
jgi:cell division protein ZapE